MQDVQRALRQLTKALGPCTIEMGSRKGRRQRNCKGTGIGYRRSGLGNGEELQINEADQTVSSQVDGNVNIKMILIIKKATSGVKEVEATQEVELNDVIEEVNMIGAVDDEKAAEVYGTVGMVEVFEAVEQVEEAEVFESVDCCESGEAGMADERVDDEKANKAVEVNQVADVQAEVVNVGEDVEDVVEKYVAEKYVEQDVA